MTDFTNLRAEVEALSASHYWGISRTAVLALIDKHSPKPEVWTPTHRDSFGTPVTIVRRVDDDSLHDTLVESEWGARWWGYGEDLTPLAPAFEVGQRVKVVASSIGHSCAGMVGTVTNEKPPRAFAFRVNIDGLGPRNFRERDLVAYDPTAELREWIAEYGAELTEGDDDARATFDTLLAAVIAEASRG